MTFKSNMIGFEGYHLSISIEAPHYLSEYVEYPVRLSYSANEVLSGESYVVVKRYSDFDNLKKSFKQANLPVQLPPKKLFGKFDMSVVIERQTMLERFLRCIITIPVLSKSVPITNFLQKDFDNIADYCKNGLKQVSLDFRCETEWVIGKPFSEMGCRIKKCYMSVAHVSDQKKYLLSWTEFGSEYLSGSLKLCHKVLKLLPSIKHEYIYPICYVIDNEYSVSVIRPICELGSLHDFMLKTKPTSSILTKYSYQTSYPKLTNEISLFGRQILLALKYLHDKGWPYGHLHIRNVLMITEEKCGLTDIENSIIGLIPQDRHFYVGIMKKLTFEEIDIYCFGRLIFHMIFGCCLESTFIENDDRLKCPSPTIREFLFSILTENVLKEGFPSVDCLLESPLFKSYSNRFIEKATLKFTDSCKEFLQSVTQNSLKLLVVDQKLVKSQKRKNETNVFEMKKKQKRKDDLRRTKNVVATSKYGENDSLNLVSDSKAASVSSLNDGSSNSRISDKNNNISTNLPANPAVPSLPSVASGDNPGKNQHLNMISGFNKSKLRKTATNDRSVPRL